MPGFFENVLNLCNFKTYNEIPPTLTFEKFEEHLNKLTDTEVIRKWDNKSSEENGMCYVAHFKSATLKTLVEKVRRQRPKLR